MALALIVHLVLIGHHVLDVFAASDPLLPGKTLRRDRRHCEGLDSPGGHSDWRLEMRVRKLF